MLNWLKSKLNLWGEAHQFNLLIIGAQKGGTTSLHSALAQHPDIFMTQPIKEPGFFLPFDVMQQYYSNKGIAIKNSDEFLRKYLQKGYRGERYFGESSTFYSTQEWSTPKLAQSIYDYNPDMKIIFICRNRVDRIISHFFHEKNKNEDLKFEDFLNRPEAFGISCYYARLKPYLEVFSREAILILSFEEMIKNHKLVMNKIFTFLDLENTIQIENFPKKNERKVLSYYNIQELKQIISQHERYPELLEDDKFFMHFSRTNL